MDGIQSQAAPFGAFEEAPVPAIRPKGRVCFTVWDYFADNAPLLDAGLLGPVKLEYFRAAEGD